MTDNISPRGECRPVEINAELAALRAKIDALTAERDAAKAMAVRVKPLAWELRAGTEGPYYCAPDPLYGLLVEAPDEETCDKIDDSRRTHILAALDPAPVSDEALIRAAIEAAADKVLDMQGRFVMGHPHANAEHDSALSRIAATIRVLATTEGIAAIRERAKG